ncbi:hypothetical protein QE152_g30696 [Popillia japonica]|uniref:Uncharacterized protein n=1 Tax=Popillia japonica TaxID=7064 RepID=A0AAW1JDQ4_POPJA
MDNQTVTLTQEQFQQLLQQIGCSSSKKEIDILCVNRKDTASFRRTEKRKRISSNSEVEPEWIKEYRKEQQKRHDEKMAVLKQLIDVLKD